MTNRRNRSVRGNLTYEQCEDRALLTLIFVLNGNAYSAASPDILTLSGPIATNAHVASAFGLSDANVVVSQSAASLKRDLPQANIYTYDGSHGVGINACQPALNEFLANL